MHVQRNMNKPSICFGFSQTTPGSYDFLLQSGSMEPRRIIKVVSVKKNFGFTERTVYHAQLADRSTVVPSSSTPADPASGTDTVMPDLTSQSNSPLSSNSSDTDDSMILVKILSHNGTTLCTAEYLCEYSDGDTVYQHFTDLAGDPVLEAYYALYKRPRISTSPAPPLIPTPTRRSVRFLTVPAVGGRKGDEQTRMERRILL